MHTETITYYQQETKLVGYLAYTEETKAARPAVIVAHAWKGLDTLAKEKAKELAELGMIAFAADIYGDGKEAHTNEEAASLMDPLFQDRKLLQERLKAAYDTIKKHPLVDSKRIGGIGFCFGGLAIIELFRSGVDLKGVVSFHAVLGNTMKDLKAKCVPIAQNIQGSCLILQGHDDPLVTAQDIAAIQAEFTEAKVDWEMDIYGGTSHAFTDPQANDPALGLKYNPKAAKRSWEAMKNFFEEVF